MALAKAGNEDQVIEIPSHTRLRQYTLCWQQSNDTNAMGVTIHYEGTLNSESDFDRAIDFSVDFATRNGMAFERFAA